jgi:hypothetical protein
MVTDFLQNHYIVGDYDSSSDGETDHVNVESPVHNPAAEQPAATDRRSQRERKPRNLFQAGQDIS